MTTRRLLLKAQDLKQVLQRYLAPVAAVVVGVLGAMVNDGAEVVTVITGSEAEESVTAEIKGHLAEEHDVVVSVVADGQPLHPYLFGVE